MIIINGSITNKTTLYIDANLCHTCQRCIAQRACKVNAIVRIDRDEPPFVDVHRCYGCMVCVMACPFQALATG